MHLQHVITIKDATIVARESSNPTLQERIHDIMKVRSEQNSGCFWVCGMVGTHQFVDVILGHVLFTWTFNLDCMTTLHIWLRVHWLWDDQASSIIEPTCNYEPWNTCFLSTLSGWLFDMLWYLYHAESSSVDGQNWTVCHWGNFVFWSQFLHWDWRWSSTSCVFSATTNLKFDIL